jgi:hypothetical protein
MKTIFVLCERTLRTSSMLSIAALRPTSAIEPAPLPSVKLVPKRLRIGVTHDELNAFYSLPEHVVNGIASSSANANYFNNGSSVFRKFKL